MIIKWRWNRAGMPHLGGRDGSTEISGGALYRREGSPEAVFPEDEGCLTILRGTSVRADVWWSNAMLCSDAGLWRAANEKEPWSLISIACFQLRPLNCSALGLKAIKNIWALHTWNQALKYFHPLLKINFPYLLARRKCNPLWRKAALSRTSAISHMCLYNIP